LGFVGPEDEEIVAGAFVLWLVETAEDMGVEQHLEEGVHIASLGLELLRHGDTDDFSPVDIAEVEGVFSGAENLGDFRGEKILKVVRDGLADSADLLGRLLQVALAKMIENLVTAWRLVEMREVIERGPGS